MRVRLVVPAALLAGLVACAPPRPHADPAPAASGDCVPTGRWVEPRTRRPVAASQVLERAARARVVLLGEHHERADDHRWQLQTLAALHAARPDLVVGFEMFPRRVQPALDRWVAGDVDERAFLLDSDWAAVWGFDAALYLPLFHFARLNAVPMRALNVDRALVTRVGERGFAAVPEAEREGVGLPSPATAEYEAVLAQAFAAHGAAGAPGDDAARRRFVEAQLTWDRAMAEALAQALAERPGALAVGIMGSGHLERRLGVPRQLAALGIDDVVVLVPWDAERDCADLTPDVADAVFGIAHGGADAEGERPRLGVRLAPAEGGVLVAGVVPGSVAAAAGLRDGDVIVAAAGQPIAAADALRGVVERQAPGTWLPLRVRRGRLERTVVAKFPPEP